MCISNDVWLWNRREIFQLPYCLRAVRLLSLCVRTLPYGFMCVLWSLTGWALAFSRLPQSSEKLSEGIWVVMGTPKWMKWHLGGRRVWRWIFWQAFSLDLIWVAAVSLHEYIQFKVPLQGQMTFIPPKSVVRIWYVISELVYQPACDSTHLLGERGFFPFFVTCILYNRLSVNQKGRLMTLARSSSDLISVDIYGTKMTSVIHAGSGLCTALLAWRMDSVFLIMFLWETYAM